jgi:arylsulfatase A-like enzyme
VGSARFDAKQFTPPPRVGSDDAEQIPLIFRDLSAADKSGINAAYYNSVRYLDTNIGRVLNLLAKHGLEENTLVVYMADHGYCLGHHGRFEKHCGYDPAMRVPLIMRWPGKIRKRVVRDLTESVDVPHTILDMMGAPPLPVQHGRSLRPYLEGKRPQDPRDHVFCEYLENEEAYIRTRDHKYIFCTGRRERTDGYKTETPTPGIYQRLYSLKADPDEFRDIAKEQPLVVAGMQLMLLDRFRATHPEASAEPRQAHINEILSWYLRPRDAQT